MQVRSRQGWQAEEEARRRPLFPTTLSRVECESPTWSKGRPKPPANIQTLPRTLFQTQVYLTRCLVGIQRDQCSPQLGVVGRQFSKEPTQGQGAAYATLPLRRVQPVGVHPHLQARTALRASHLCHLRLPWMKATCQIGGMRKIWCFLSLHLPPTSGTMGS